METPIRTASPKPRPAGPLLGCLRARGLGVDVLAVQCGVTSGLVYAWDAGTRRPADKHAATIAALIGTERTRELYALTGPKTGRGQLPRPGSRRERLAFRTALKRLHEAAPDVARLAAPYLSPERS